MVKQEIREFKVSVKGNGDLTAFTPCSLFSVINDNHILNDIYTDSGISDYAAFSDLGCTFTSEFDVPAIIASMNNIVLRMSGIDAAASVTLNGSEILVTNNINRTYDVDVRRFIKVGMNTLVFSFRSPSSGARMRRAVSLSGTKAVPAVPDMGIFGKVELLGFNHKMLSAVRVSEEHKENSVILGISIETLGYDSMSRAVATLTSPAGNVYFCGLMDNRGTITITDPNLWWPKGLGMHSLYKLTVTLYSDDEPEDSREMYIGLKTVSLQKDDTGKPYLVVNGVPFSPMGARYVPDDIIYANSDRDRIRRTVEAAMASSINSFFISSADMYASEEFLTACDECGITVWQEIPEITYGDLSPDEIEDIKAEIKENLLRESRHASLTVIMGSPRLKELFSDDDCEKLKAAVCDYEGMNILDLDGSLKSGLEFISYPSLPTYSSICKLVSPENRNIGSYAFELHGADDDTVSEMISSSYSNFPYANGMNEFSYTSGLSAADNTRRDVLEIRRREDKPLGIFLGRFNDSWGAVSPSAVDYYGGKKPLYYYQKHFFSPVYVMVEFKGNKAKFILNNTSGSDFQGIFAYWIMDTDNRPVFRDSFPIRLRSSDDMNVHSVDFSSEISGRENKLYLLYSVTDNSLVTYKDVHLFVKTKRFKFPKPVLKTEISGNGNRFMISVASDTFAKGVEISFDGIEAEMSDNYFDITGKAPVRVSFTTNGVNSVEKLRRALRIRSVYDLGREE